MKINICCKESDERNDYINVTNNFDKLDFVGQNEATELILQDTLNYVPSKDLDRLLQYWCSKIRHNGELTIVANNIDLINNAFYHKQINNEEFRAIMYGNGYMGCYSIDEICNKLISLGFNILNKRLTNLMFIIKAQRP